MTVDLPPRPWDWTCAETPTANGTFQVYIVDATGKKIAAIWAKPEQRKLIADTVVGLVNDAVHKADMRRDGNRSLPFSRDELGRMVREAWIRWAKRQPNPKPSWLVPYEELLEPNKEVDRQIGEALARWTLIGDAAAHSANPVTAPEHERTKG